MQDTIVVVHTITEVCGLSGYWLIFALVSVGFLLHVVGSVWTEIARAFSDRRHAKGDVT